MKTLHEIELTTAWINRLRWFAILGQVGTILVVSTFAHIGLPLGSLGGVILIEVIFAAACEAIRARHNFTPGRLLACMVGDVAILTALLYLTGGPENPFNFLYLVHVTLALVALGERAAWMLVGLSALAFGALFFWSQPLHFHGAEPHSAMGLHMQGMWVGFIVAAVFIVAFASRLTRELRDGEAELRRAQDRAQNSERLAALATLAAGAAHELNTPLSTIAVVAKELEYGAAELGEELVGDARVIRQEIDRCRGILEQLSLDSGYAAGSEAHRMTIRDVLDGCESLADERTIVELTDDVREVELLVHARPLRLAINAVVDNALKAGEGVVAVHVMRAADDLVMTVRDQGSGMSPEVASHALEPFFTARDDGMGLGLFLARGVAEGLGGDLELESAVGVGTTVTFRLPVFGGADVGQ